MDGLMRTKIVFLDLPYHYEYEVAIYQIIPVGFVINFENLLLVDKKNPQKVRTIDGPYFVETVKTVYKGGLFQYLELTPCKS